MPNATDITLDHFNLRCLLIGASGVGKTKLLGSFRQCGRIYVFDFDGGMLTLRGEDIEYDTYGDTYRNGVLVETGWKRAQAQWRKLQQDCPYRTIAFDSATLLGESMLKQILHDNKRPRAEWVDWGDVYTTMRDLFNEGKLLNVNLVFTCHEELEKDEVTKRLIYIPMIIGNKLPLRAPIFFDEVYRLAVVRNAKGEQDHVLYTQPGENFQAKSRLGLPAVIANASFAKLVQVTQERKG